jgi:ATP-dependent RNA helicase RhlE
LKNTEKLIGKKIPVIKDHPFHTDDLVVQKRDSNNKPMAAGGERPKSSRPNNSRPNNNKKKPDGASANVGFKKPKNKNFTRKK